MREKPIVNCAGLLVASEMKRAGDSFIHIHRSPQVQTTSKLFARVKKRFKGQCCLEMENETVEWKGWALGLVNISSYYMYESCPGEIEHSCGVMSLHMCGQRIYGVDRDGIYGSVHQYQVSMP